MGFGNLGIWEMLVIALIVLVVFGPRRLPEIARSMGGALREFKKGVNEIQRELEEAERDARIDPPASAPPSPAPTIEAEPAPRRSDAAHTALGPPAGAEPASHPPDAVEPEQTRGPEPSGGSSDDPGEAGGRAQPDLFEGTAKAPDGPGGEPRPER
ncbi:MAG: twin-arginine translocase TatA/TatE family subunit [Gemmatimonadota bacterium]